ncbi:MAG: HEAT repeat domain-containing protein [Planctomycetota bacterium]|nr:HEAT repeat domain-containing protein [Planctomycetota bacterium]MDA1140358.1 HEAT repeat domain-containing protein [Planctomycetota bacterium]
MNLAVLYILLTAAPGHGEEPTIILGDDDLKQMVRDLGAETFQEREKASDELRKAGAASSPFLIEATRSKDPEVRARAESLLRSLAQILMADLISAQPDQAYSQLKKMGPIAFPILEGFAEFDEPRVHYMVARLFAAHDTTASLDYLVRVVRFSDGLARQFALEELAHRKAIEHLLLCVEDGGTEDIQEKAAAHLIEIADKSILPRLWKHLDNRENEGRALVLRIIIALDPQTSEDKLLPFLEAGDESLSVSNEVITHLGFIGGEKTEKQLIRMLNEMNPLTIATTSLALRRFGYAELDAILSKKLFSNESRERRAALSAMSALRLTSAIDAISELLYDPDRNTRFGAISALAGMRTTVVIPTLVPLLADADPDIRTETVMAIRRIGGTSPIAQLALVPGIPRLIKNQTALPWCIHLVRTFLKEKTEQAVADEAVALIYKHNLIKHSDPAYRDLAAIVLYRNGQGVAEKYLIKALENDDEFIRLAVAKHLGPMGDPDAIPALIEAIDDEIMLVQRAVIYALGSLDAKQACPKIRRLMLDETAWPEVRKIAATSLATMLYEPAFTDFGHLSRDKDLEVRIGAGSALATLGNITCIPTFISIMKEGNAHQRRVAQMLLQQYTHRSFGFNATDDKVSRDAAMERWDAWWEKYANE